MGCAHEYDVRVCTGGWMKVLRVLTEEKEREVPKLLSGVREAGVELLMFCLSDDLTRDDRETGGESDSRGQRPSTVRSSAVSPPPRRQTCLGSSVRGFVPVSGRRRVRPPAPGQTARVAFVFGVSALRSQPLLVTAVN